MNRIFLFIAYILLFSSCKEKKEEKCEFKFIHRFETIRGISGYDTSYYHRVLIKDFPKSCFDSLTCIKLVNGYKDTVSVDKPVGGISFHNSGEWYYHPSPWVKDALDDASQIDDHLVTVFLSDEGKYEFVFYNEDGEMIYQGPNWTHSIE